MDMGTRTTDADVDVIVVGAGPAGSTAASYLARAGLDVLLLEKATFPREKVCGDGLTPRGVAQLVKLGIDTSDPAWIKNQGLRIYGGGMRLQLPWPELGDYPGYGLVRRRMDFDELLAQHAQKAGAQLFQDCTVTGAIADDATGRVVGVTARHRGGSGEISYRARVVVAADGNSSRFALSRGIARRDDRPMGVAVRTYFQSPRHDDDWLESWLELWDGKPGDGALLPGYGWVFGMGDGTSNVGLGVLNTSAGYGNTDYRKMLWRWLEHLPPEWQFDPDHEVGRVAGAGLPMGFNRKPHYDRGLLLIGDAGGMVNPFNGEGIAYAMESAEIAADVIVSALARDSVSAREMALQRYPTALDQAYGGYYTLGGIFVKLIGNPKVMQLCTRHGLPRPLLMKFTLKLLANLYEPRGGDASDRLISALTKLAPAA
jgi:geranylgeranyl reductase family protein